MPEAQSSHPSIEPHPSGLYYTRHHCMLCRSRRLTKVVNLAPTPMLNPNTGILREDTAADQSVVVPLDLHLCQECGHLQLVAIGNPALQYSTYTYRTSISRGLPEHFATLVDDIADRTGPGDGRLAVEIGSNDGTVLRLLSRAGFAALGIDPAEEIAREASGAGAETIVGFFDRNVAGAIKAERGPASVIVANNVLANIDDLDEIITAVHDLLAPEGLFVFETQYGLDVIDHTLIDTVYHEHISYYLVAPLRQFLRRHGLDLIDVIAIPTKGGSIRCFAAHAARALIPTDRVERQVALERDRRFDRAESYQAFDAHVAGLSRKIHDAVAAIVKSGGRVAGYGVSIGTMTLLTQFDLWRQLTLLIDDDAEKQMLLTGPGVRIPVRSNDALRTERPDAIVVFAWRYLEPILKSTEAYRRAGGRLIVPLPSPYVIERDGSRTAL
jgi:SAM-dependent methyltransferase